ncbi:collagen triple helix repeat family protein [Plakobranchus ocellatus]|uniref:Collagen triple helix repeat family protein n=1 Tax=Plakobranchus ocellatus TaxID=259542 RepID=A0AAV4ANR2_9GAST|nr:collagen triple helix repeat family protein [Plakobranchus ocellatus]
MIANQSGILFEVNRGQLSELVTMAKFTALLLVTYLVCFMIMIEAKPLEKAKAVERRFIFTTAAIGTAMTAATAAGTVAMLPLSAGASMMLPVALLAMGVAPA